MAASQARITQSQQVRATQRGGRLDDAERKAKISDLVFFVLSSEKNRPIHNKANMMKAVDMTGRNKQDQEDVLVGAIDELEEVFGLNLYSLDNVGKKGSYLLVNSLKGGLDAVGEILKEEVDVENTERSQQKAKTSLLFSLLALIFMSPGGIVRDDVIDPFLVQLGLLPGPDTTANGTKDIEDMVKKVFGNDKGDIKALIKDEFSRKQHYIAIAEMADAGETENKIYEYRWGIRAQGEVRKAEMLKIVAEMYDCPLKDFKEQYDMVKNSGEKLPDEDNEENGGGKGAGEAQVPMEQD